MVQMETATANEQPWEGIVVTASGAVVHLRKFHPRNLIMQELMAMELTPDNLVIIYTSSYLHMIEGGDTDKQQEIEHLIHEIGSFENDWRILKMDLTPRGDIIVAV